MFNGKIYRISILIILFLALFWIKGLNAKQPLVSSQDHIYLSLDDVSHLALENNLDIQIAKYDVYIKRNDILEAESIFDTILSADISFKNDQTKSSSVLAGTKTTAHDYKIGLSKKIPSGTTLGLEFQNTRTWTNSSYISVNPNHDASIKFSITQPVGKNFFGLIDRGDIKITKLDIANADYTCLDKIESYLASVQGSFWKFVLLKEELQIKREMLKRAENLYKIYKSKLQIGLVEEPDLLATEANVNIRKNEVLIAEENLEITKNQLLLELNEEKLDLKIHPLEELSLDSKRIDLISSLKQAIENRRDYLKAKNDVTSKDIKVTMKKNNLWPEIDIEASFLRNGLSQDYKTAWQGISSENNPEVYVGLTFSLPLENRDAKGQFQKAKLEKAKYLLLLKKSERQILTQINDRITQLNTAIGKATTNENIVDLQQRKLKAQEIRFHSGRSNSDLMIRYQQDLLDAELSLAQSLYKYKIAVINLKLTQNSLLDEYWKEEL